MHRHSWYCRSSEAASGPWSGGHRGCWLGVGLGAGCPHSAIVQTSRMAVLGGTSRQGTRAAHSRQVRHSVALVASLEYCPAVVCVITAAEATTPVTAGALAEEYALVPLCQRPGRHGRPLSRVPVAAM